MQILPLKPKATAVWLIENTSLTFEQIAAFCGMHPLEVKGMADGEVHTGLIGLDPIGSGQLTLEEIKRCEASPRLKLELSDKTKTFIKTKAKKEKKYVPVAKRQDKPNAVSWLIKNHPELTDAQIVKLVGTTKTTIEAVRNKTHWNAQNIKPRDPVMLGLCSQTELNNATALSKKNSKNLLEDDSQ